ncbi:hypothetical protein [Aestuariivivens sediminis]|uniref:hypothetical protein n=1 Tax=Aestuariivivens sediminis TaxID=2913557 RepID=UPI001F5A99FA|nr:hypothetical protein [Aestuariivivens sediminis]
MDTHFALFNQINSLSFWLLLESNYRSNVSLNAEEDLFFISVKKGNAILYAHEISNLSKKNKKYLQFELSAVVNHLLHIKNNITYQTKKSA